MTPFVKRRSGRLATVRQRLSVSASFVRRAFPVDASGALPR
jgi:hypothetical protein